MEFINRELKIVTWNTDQTIKSMQNAVEWFEGKDNYSNSLLPTIAFLQEVPVSKDSATYTERRKGYAIEGQAVGTLLYSWMKEDSKPQSKMVLNYEHPTKPAAMKQVVTVFSHHFKIRSVENASTIDMAHDSGVRNSHWVIASHGGNKFAVCNVHFQVPSKTSPNIHPKTKMFFEALLKDKAEYEAKKYIVIIAGDFNTLPEHLSKVSRLPKYVDWGRATNVDRSDPKKIRYLRLDYIIYSGDAHEECECVFEFIKGSDHKALSISVMLE